MARRVSIPLCNSPSGGSTLSLTEGKLRRFGGEGIVVFSATNERGRRRSLVTRVGRLSSVVGPGRTVLIVSKAVNRRTNRRTGTFSATASVKSVVVAGLSNSTGNKNTVSTITRANTPVGFVKANREVSSFRLFSPREFVSELLNVKSVGSLVRGTRRGVSRSVTRGAVGGVLANGFALVSVGGRFRVVGGVNPVRRMLGVVPNVKGGVSGRTSGVARSGVRSCGVVVSSVARRRVLGPGVVGRSHIREVTENSNISRDRMGRLLGCCGGAGGAVGNLKGHNNHLNNNTVGHVVKRFVGEWCMQVDGAGFEEGE